MLRDDLTDVPLGELSVLRKRIGDKKFAQLYRGNEAGPSASGDANSETGGNDPDQEGETSQTQADRSYSSGRKSEWPSKESPAIQKRANHNRPLEVSTRRPTAFRKERLREFCAQTSYLSHSRDPRFDERCGEYNEHAFRSTHAFLDTIRQQEKEQLERTRQRLKKGLMKVKDKTKNAEADADDDESGLATVVSRKRQQLEKVDYLLERFRQRELAEKRTALRKRVRDQVVRNERERVAAGKQPYFPKRSELRKLELFERFKELRKAGRLDSFLKKKRKRESSKQKRKLDVKL